MHRLFLERLAIGLLAGLALSCLPQAGRAADGERVRFYTWDKVEIHGTFYPGRGNKSPCVLMLHPLGGSSEQDGWADLAKQLQKKELAVLTFDFRGHGESTAVDPEFWTINQASHSLKSYRPGKLRDQISYKDFTSLTHWAALLDDIAAAKLFLDRKNDSGECNSSHVIVIGAEAGASLGAMWIWSEWQRRKVASNVFDVGAAAANRVEGQNIAGAVYLSISPAIGAGTRQYDVPVSSWLKTPVREKVPMYFLYGEKDTRAANFSKHLADGVLRAEKDNKMKLTGKMPIKDTKLAGRELLGKPSLPTEDLIVKYVATVVEARRTNDWARRDADRTVLVPVPIRNYLNR
jgi:alpha/beta superfamily hydrolase